jgi:hypothetical protein
MGAHGIPNLRGLEVYFFESDLSIGTENIAIMLYVNQFTHLVTCVGGNET